MAEIDTSAAAVRVMVAYLRDVWPHSTDVADLLEALLAQRDAAVARAEKAERDATETMQDLHTCQKANGELFTERDSALARVAELEGEVAGMRADAARWRALVTSFGPEVDISSPDAEHAIIVKINVVGCEVHINDELDFKATLERALDDEIKRIAAAVRLPAPPTRKE